MANYFNYLREILVQFFQNVGLWFRMRFADPWGPVPGEFQNYHSVFVSYSSGFGFFGWLFFVLFAILAVALLGAIVFLIYWLIRRYVRFYRKELDKDQLKMEVERLNLELYQTMQEKDRILGLQVRSLGVAAPELPKEGENEEEKEGEKSDASNFRFPRLKMVDEAYALAPVETHLPDDAAGITLAELCERFRLFAASQLHLYYTIETMRQLFASMGTSKVLILEGISGTGKTSMPYALGRFFQHNAVICSVQPSWRDRSELLGYYNDFTKKFTETEFLRAVYEATFRDDVNLIVLDEMNLARIEYYFAEFLSIMEMPNVNEWNISVVAAPRNDDPEHLHDGFLLIPQNIWFVGTANNDDSTFTITDKVYDRAMSLFFDNKGVAFDAPFTLPCPMPVSYLDNLYQEAYRDYPISQRTLDRFAELDNFVIAKFKLAFGNRIMKQLSKFVPCYVACGGTELQAVDFVFSNKILKKFEVLNVGFLKDELNELDGELTRLFGKSEFRMSRNKIKALLKSSGLGD